MKFSIITATYNSEKTVRDTIESVLRQSQVDYEYLIIDGGSKDNTIRIVEEYAHKFDGRMRYISEPDKGIYDAMNKGFKMAKGDVFALINSDDFFDDSFALKKVANCFDMHEGVDAVYADLCYVSQYDKDKVIRRWVTGEQRPFKRGWLPAHPTFYVKRSVYEKYGYFNLDYKLAADFELMLRFVEKYHIRLAYLAEPLVRMRLGGATSKSIHNVIQQNKECMRAFKENGLPVSPLYPFFRFLPKIKQYLR